MTTARKILLLLLKYSVKQTNIIIMLRRLHVILIYIVYIISLSFIRILSQCKRISYTIKYKWHIMYNSYSVVTNLEEIDRTP